MASNCPPHTVHPSQKLNQDNIGELVVASHKNFVEAAKSDPKQPSTIFLSELTNAVPSTQAPTKSSESEFVPEAKPACSNPRKHRVSLSPVQSEHDRASTNNHDNSDNDSESQVTEPQCKPVKPKKKKKKTIHSKSTHYSLPYYD